MLGINFNGKQLIIKKLMFIKHSSSELNDI